MSFTVMRFKNGHPAPIKLSIWDAFKGVPEPKTRSHRCGCCNKIHRPGTKSAPPEEAVEVEDKGAKDAKGAKTQGEQKDESGFTAEENTTIIKMKAKNKTWQEIANETKKPKDALRAHWKSIDPAKTGNSPDEKTEMKDDKKDAKIGEQNDDGSKRLSKRERKALAVKAKEEEVRKMEWEKCAGKPEEERQNAAQQSTDSKPTSVHDRRKWELAAAKHYDRTGRRITPEQARKMAES